MEQALQIIQYVAMGLSAVVIIAQFVYNKVKGSKSRFLSKTLGFLQELSESVGFAEQMTNLEGEAKKYFAIKHISMFCENKKIKFTDEQLDAAIEMLIKLTKAVNAREKDLIGTDNELEGDNNTYNEMSANGEASLADSEIIE